MADRIHEMKEYSMYLNYKRHFPLSRLRLIEVEQQLCQKTAHVSLERTQKHCCSKEHTGPKEVTGYKKHPNFLLWG